MPTGVYPRTEYHRKKISLGNMGKHHYWLGKKLSKEHKEKIAKAGLGRVFTLETRIKMSNKQKGDKGSNWKGGVSPINMRIRKSFRYKDWRTAIFARDNYTCVECKMRSGNGKAVKLNADHIKPFALYPELRFEIDNGRTLCVACHYKTNTHGFRKIYQSYASKSKSLAN